MHAIHFSSNGYYIATPPPCCGGEAHKWLEPHAACHSRSTFSTLFDYSNRQPWLNHLFGTGFGFSIVSPRFGNYRVPKAPDDEIWDVGVLVDALLYERRPIIIAGTSAAPIIVHEYWRQRVMYKVPIIDVGHSLDRFVYGKKITGVNPDHTCSWDQA